MAESLIEDDKRGDEVGAVRRFNYSGNWIRQRLLRHSDDARLLTYQGIDRLVENAAVIGCDHRVLRSVAHSLDPAPSGRHPISNRARMWKILVLPS